MAYGEEKGNHPRRKVARHNFDPPDDGDEDGPQNDDWIHQAYWNQAAPEPDNSYFDAGRLRDDTKPRYS
jgi:hypothetical protein